MSVYAYINSEGILNVQSDDATSTYALRQYLAGLKPNQAQVKVLDSFHVLNQLQEPQEAPQAPTQYVAPTQTLNVPPDRLSDARKAMDEWHDPRTKPEGAIHRHVATGDVIDLADHEAVLNYIGELRRQVAERSTQCNNYELGAKEAWRRVEERRKEIDELRSQLQESRDTAEHLGKNRDSWRTKAWEANAERDELKAQLHDRDEHIESLGKDREAQANDLRELRGKLRARIKAANQVIKTHFPHIDTSQPPEIQAERVIHSISCLKGYRDSVESQVDKQAETIRSQRVQINEIDRKCHDRSNKLQNIQTAARTCSDSGLRKVVWDQTVGINFND